MKCAAFVAFLVSGCATPSSVAPPAPVAAEVSTPGASVTTSGAAVVTSPACPGPGELEREHCVWLKPLPGVPGAELAKRMNAAKFPVEVEGDKVTAYWKADRIEAFFGVKPGYMKTGGSSGGTVCLMVMPKGAKPAVKGIAGWAVDDPVCEM